MEEKKNTYKIYEGENNIGEVQVADDVVAVIAGLAAMEVDGVSSMAGNITSELISKLGMKRLSKGVSISVTDNTVTVNLRLNLEYKVNIVEVSSKVQERVKQAIENMTGLVVACVNVSVSSINVEK